MKNLLALAALASAFACSAANAAILTVEPLIAANNVYSLYLNGEATTFNGVGLSVKGDGGAAFQNVTTGNLAGEPRPAGHLFTYRNRMLDADPAEIVGGKGWSLLGVVNTAQEITFNGGPVGSSISTAAEPGGKLFLANIMLPPGATATATLQLVNGIDTVFNQTLQFPIPEPATLAMAGMGVVGMIAVSRRRKA